MLIKRRWATHASSPVAHTDEDAFLVVVVFVIVVDDAVLVVQLTCSLLSL